MSRENDIKFRNWLSSEKATELDGSDDTLTNTRGAKLLRAVEEQPKPPCVDRGDGRPCEFYRRCATELLACRAFYAYTREPLDRKEYSEWLQMERKPSEKMYAKTYK